MRWFTIDFNKHVDNCFARVLILTEMVPLLKCVLVPVKKINEDAIYRMQHSGITISLEKVLNEYLAVVGYSPTNHDATKLIYIEDAPIEEALYIFQDNEAETSFLEDDGDDNEDDVFLDNEIEGISQFLWTVFIPSTIEFQETKLRSVIDSYRYIGTKYNIQTYEL